MALVAQLVLVPLPALGGQTLCLTLLPLLEAVAVRVILAMLPRLVVLVVAVVVMAAAQTLSLVQQVTHQAPIQVKETLVAMVLTMLVPAVVAQALLDKTQLLLLAVATEVQVRPTRLLVRRHIILVVAVAVIGVAFLVPVQVPAAMAVAEHGTMLAQLIQAVVAAALLLAALV